MNCLRASVRFQVQWAALYPARNHNSSKQVNTMSLMCSRSAAELDCAAVVALLTRCPPGCWLNHLTVKQLSPTQLDMLPSHEQRLRRVQDVALRSSVCLLLPFLALVPGTADCVGWSEKASAAPWQAAVPMQLKTWYVVVGSPGYCHVAYLIPGGGVPGHGSYPHVVAACKAGRLCRGFDGTILHNPAVCLLVLEIGYPDWPLWICDSIYTNMVAQEAARLFTRVLGEADFGFDLRGSLRFVKMTLIRTPTGSPGRGSLPDPASASLAPGSVADSDADSTLALLVAQLNLKDADIDILCETLRTRYSERFVSSTPAAASAAAGSATHSLASSAALLAQQQAAALIASAAAGGQLQHVTNGNVEQLVPGATVAAANLLTSGVVPPAGVSNVAVAGAPRAPKAGSGGAGPSGSGRGKYCFAWANTGACERGDACTGPCLGLLMEFGLPVYPQVVEALCGWRWCPAALDSPAGLLCYRGSAALAPCATADPSTATTSVPAPAVVAFELPDWQRAVWARRPLCVELFDTLSAQDVDRSFLMGVVRNGVLLVPDPAVLTPYCLPNYSSALQESSTISNMLAAEVAQSWVVQVPTRPRFVHPLGAVPKSDGGIRVIHDHSVPLGSSVNDHEVYVRYSWDSLDDALQFVVPHVFMARLDVSAYYRHFMVHPSQWDLQGFEFGGAFYVDSRVQFGLRLAPELAHRFTMFIKRVLHANGVQAVVGVMDDYLLLHADYRTCLVMLAVAVALLSDLGFDVNLKPGKTVLPAKVQKFVGVVINSARMSLSLPSDKLSSLLQDVTFAVQARTLKRKFLQRLVGKMQWASRVIYGGRVFMRSCTDALSVVLHPGHHASVSSHMRADLRWWLSAAAANNGIVSLARRRRTHFVFTDACLSPVPCIGIFAEGAFFSLSLPELARHQLLPPAGDEDINVWECFAVLAAVRLLGDYWSGAHVVVFSDNASTVAWVGQGAPRPPAARQLVGVLFQACLSQDIRLSVRHIPGVTLTPALHQLAGEVVALQAGALAASTRKKYDQFELYWVRFLLVFGLLSFVVAPTEQVLCLYVAFLARSVSFGGVKNYMQGLQRFLLDRGWDGHFSKFWGLQQALSGLRRLAKPVTRKLPVTPYVLLAVLRCLDLSSSWEVMVFTAMLVAFGAFLRKANVCAASRSLSHVHRSLLRSDVVVDLQQYCLYVTLRFMKNAQFQEAVHTVVVAGRKGHPLDPVYWWCEYVSRVPAPPGAAAFGSLVDGIYVPLVHSEFVSWVKRLVSRAGFDSRQYSGHSFRRGAASFSFLVGLPEFLIKELGAWRSQVYQVYLDLTLSQKLSVHASWFDAMGRGQLGRELVPPQV
eukprot:gene5934-biopygen7741